MIFFFSFWISRKVKYKIIIIIITGSLEINRREATVWRTKIFSFCCNLYFVIKNIKLFISLPGGRCTFYAEMLQCRIFRESFFVSKFYGEIFSKS